MGRGKRCWTPTAQEIKQSNIGRLMAELGFESYDEFFCWARDNREDYWSMAVDILDIQFLTDPEAIVDLSGGVEKPIWLPGAQMNIVESCFRAPPESVAILFQREGEEDIHHLTYADLQILTDRVAQGIAHAGFAPGDAIGIIMPMTPESVALYLGIIKAGCVVVGIADSFASKEIGKRLGISGAKAVFTMDYQIRAGKRLELYSKVKDATDIHLYVIPWEQGDGASKLELQDGDESWQDFLSDRLTSDAAVRSPMDPVNILFSSGTTSDPKAIPWTQTTPIKAAADAHFHHDIRAGDVVAWPTSLGWMMGPWLIYASLLNKATMGLFVGSPASKQFCDFVTEAKVSMLGVVPSLVRAWRANGATKGADWKTIRAFSSTGECSTAEDYWWLMQEGGGRPVIEYCGGTEIGGAYITGTLVQPQYPATFSTPALGLDLVILDDGNQADKGEVFLVPPSIGMSTSLLNRDHHQVYFEDTPEIDGKKLRHHGDAVERLENGYFHLLGRADDTMNLGGIKVSSAEIERILSQVGGVEECAAIGIPPKGGGPEALVICVVREEDNLREAKELLSDFQGLLRHQLNPLFKVHDVRIIDELPRTASGKVMRRVLRSES